MTARTRRGAGKTYIVRNPRGIPKGRHIIRIAKEWFYEGDSFDPPSGIDVARLLRDGFIEESGAAASLEDTDGGHDET